MRKLIALMQCLLAAACCAQASRPNVVLIVADDLGWRDLACYGHEWHQTPNLDALAASGVRFTTAYSNAPNCAPSRASLMTGMYTPRHGVLTVGTSSRGKAENRRIIPSPNRTDLDDGFETIAERLDAAGYATGHFGKWHLGEDPTAQGFDVNVAGGTRGAPRSYFSPYRNDTLPDGPEGEHLTARLTDEAIAFMRDHADEPFFVYLPYFTVHTPIQGREDLIEKYQEMNDPRIKPAYAAMVESLDENVGRLLGALDELGETDDTLVLFTSDNGGHGVHTSNAPLRGSKGMLYEGGIRVPFIASGYGVERSGSTDDTPVIGSDLYPTILDIVGLEHPAGVDLDGRTLAPLLAGDSDESLKGRTLFWHFPAYLEPYARSQGLWRQTPASAIRRGRFKLIYFYEDGDIQFFDLENDPGETRSVAGENEHAATWMYTDLVNWRIEIGAPIPHEPEPKYKPQP